MAILYPSSGGLILPQGMRQPVQFPVQPYIYLGSRRLAGYKGACMDVQPVGGGTAKAIGFTGTNHVADWRVAAGQVGSKGLISKLYDQSGNGLHVTQGTAANMPAFNLDNRFCDMLPCVFDGSNPADDASIPQVYKALNFPTVSLGSRATTMFFVLRQMSNGDGGQLINLQTSGSVPLFDLYWVGSYDAGQPVQIYNGVSDLNYNYGVTRNDVTVLGLNFGASNVSYFFEGATATNTALASGATATKGVIGGDVAGAFAGIFDLLCFVAFNSTLSAANQTLVANALLNGYTLRQSYDCAVICDGDSRMAGFGVDYNQGLMDVTRPLLGRRPAWYNIAVSGQTAQTANTNYDSNAAPLITAYAAKGIPVVYVSEQGVNDASNGTSASTIYNTYIKGNLTAARGDGAKTVCCTIMHETTEGGTETSIINSLNTLIKAGAGTDFDVLCDMDAVFPSGPASPAYSKDGTHCNNAGNDLLKGELARAIAQAIAA